MARIFLHFKEKMPNTTDFGGASVTSPVELSSLVNGDAATKVDADLKVDRHIEQDSSSASSAQTALSNSQPLLCNHQASLLHFTW